MPISRRSLLAAALPLAAPALLPARSALAQDAAPPAPLASRTTTTQTPVPTLIVSEHLDVVTTIERFAVASEAKDEAIGLAAAQLERWRGDDAYVSGALLRTVDEGPVASLARNGGVSAYVQWHGARRPGGPEGATIPFAPAPDRSLRGTLGRFDLLDSRTYRVAFTRQTPPMDAPSRLSREATPFAHFGLFDVAEGDQDRLLDLAREAAPGSFGTPGLLAIGFHRSLDGRRVVNLGAWSSLDGFAALLGRPGFGRGNEYFKDLARFEPDFFELAAVVPGTSRQVEAG